MRSGPEAEHLIVGGGVIGLAVAYELARRGLGVRVLERERNAAGATNAAAGMLAPISEVGVEAAELLTFGRDSLRRFPEFVGGIESVSRECCRYSSAGTLWVAIDRDQAAEIEHLARTMEQRGFSVRALEAEELRALEPHISGRVLAGLDVPDDHQIDPRALLRGLERAVAVLGGVVERGMQVEAIESESSAFVVSGRDADGSGFRVRASVVLLAAGAGSFRGLRHEAPSMGLRPVKGQLVRLRGARLLSRVLRTPDVYLVPRDDGELLIGGTVEELGFDVRATAGAVLDLLRRGFEVLPGIYEMELAEVSVGLRSAVCDHLPVIGESATPGLYFAVGHFRNGVLLAPATAHYLAEWIVEGRRPAELTPFVPERLHGAKMTPAR